MSQDFVTQVLYNGVMLVLLLSLPAVGLGLLVGFVISLFQAVTQIQEQTLVFVPKIVAMVAAAILVMPWLATHLMEYAARMFSGGLLP